ncbi:MAG: hypothetical protein FWF37_04355 [Chloroflexi bacterium]|nr:hypothetical protein [Chloroflexota bacterium]
MTKAEKALCIIFIIVFGLINLAIVSQQEQKKLGEETTKNNNPNVVILN